MHMREMDTFGTLLRGYRDRAGLAQNALARATGINVGTVNRLERDQRLPAGRRQVMALADALALTPAEINRMLDAAGLPAEGFGARITGNPTIVQLVELLQDESIPLTDRDELLSMVDRYVHLVARANGRVAGA